jgi:hypothetical protein
VVEGARLLSSPYRSRNERHKRCLVPSNSATQRANWLCY